MHPTPDGWPRISASVYYDDARAAIDWLCQAFGFEIRLLVEGSSGALVHTEIVYGEGVVMVGDTKGRPFFRSPRAAGGGNTQSLMVFVDDVEAHCARARAHGAALFQELSVSDYGPEYWSDRSYGAIDCEGHHWWFCQRLRTGNPNWSQVRDKVDRHEGG
jgi:uncharacterized glyoxalase superfamily protein PhnB